MNLNFSYSYNSDLWQYLSTTAKTVVMYGMGNGADKILAICEKYGITVADFFASDGFVRGHSFHGKVVLSYSQIKEKYGAENVIVLLSFASSLPDVLENIYRIASECELYAPDVPVCGDNLFTLEFYKENLEKIFAVRELLADELSVKIYDNVIAYKLTGDIKHLRDAESSKEEAYSLLGAESFSSIADLGAYNGDTVREVMAISKNLSVAYAFEPDRRSFRKLSDFCATVTGSPEIYPINAAAWCEDTEIGFGDEGNRNSGICAKAKTVNVTARTLDGVLDGKSIDYIKYDVEGAEKEAIIGCENTILSHRPKLLISAYHRSEDIFELPLQIHSLLPDYKLYYRRHPYIPAWDLNLLCI